LSVSIHHLADWRARGEKFVMVTAYDALIARVLDEAGIPILLVGDSLSNVLLGHPTTLQVTMDDMLHHARAVARGAKDALLVGDLPFGSYQTPEDAVRNATEFLRIGMHCVKLEGGGPAVDAVAALTDRGIPVMGHLGLTPQFVNAIGGYKVQGRGDAGDRLLEDAKALQDAGVFSLVLECVPSALGERVTRTLEIPTIGIGAGPECDGQVLVWQDMMGLRTGKAPRFVKRYADLHGVLLEAARAYARDVQSGDFPGPEHAFES
jgi:3-methyl-2-oxobutanoate hydroxymethyltransferase